MSGVRVDVLVVGAGPTGLALAAVLAAHGVAARVVDRAHDRVHESRALAIQPRTLEVLSGLGVTPLLIRSGNPAVRLCLHVGRREVSIPLFDLGLADTAYPFLLFLSQADTERILGEHVAGAGVHVERGVELTGLRSTPDDIVATVRHDTGAEEQIHAGIVVGCDGGHSVVRTAAGIEFKGSAYPQSFVLADVEADGIAPGAAHAFVAERGLLFFFPLGSPATWRLLAMRPPGTDVAPGVPVALDEVQALADDYTRCAVRLGDPVWMTNFRLHHRAAGRYRSGRVFLAGDAAHIHSPAGAQGMNTGIQDAVNLGWKLAHVVRGLADPALLDTYEPERAPIGRRVVRLTDRLFSIATSNSSLVRFARGRVAPTLVPLAFRARTGRGYAFRTVSQLAIRYRSSPLSVDGPGAPRHGPRAGDRLPDAHVVHNGEPLSLHAAVAAPGWHLLRCGPVEAWSGHEDPTSTPGPVLVHYLCPIDGPDVLVDSAGEALHRLGVPRGEAVQFLVRPDGHVGYRGGAGDPAGPYRYLRRWYGRPAPAP